MQRVDGQSPRNQEPARLDWDVQSIVLRSLAADRPKSLDLMRYAAAGLDNEELQQALQVDEQQFFAEVDAIQNDLQLLSRAFFAHHGLRSRGIDETSTAEQLALAEELLEIIAETLDSRRPSPPAAMLEELRARSLVSLVENASGDARTLLSAIVQLPSVLGKTTSMKPKAAPRQTRGFIT